MSSVPPGAGLIGRTSRPSPIADHPPGWHAVGSAQTGIDV